MGGLRTSGDLGSEPANGREADKVAHRAAVNNYAGVMVIVECICIRLGSDRYLYDQLAYKVDMTCHVTFVSGGPWEGSGTEACGATG